MALLNLSLLMVSTCGVLFAQPVPESGSPTGPVEGPAQRKGSISPASAVGSTGHRIASHVDSLASKPAGHVDSIANKPAGHDDSIANKPAGHVDSIANNPAGHVDSIANKPAGHVDSIANKPAGHVDSIVNKPASHVDSIANKPAGHVDSIANKPANHVDSKANEPAGLDDLSPSGILSQKEENAMKEADALLESLESAGYVIGALNEKPGSTSLVTKTIISSLAKTGEECFMSKLEELKQKANDGGEIFDLDSFNPNDVLDQLCLEHTEEARNVNAKVMAKFGLLCVLEVYSESWGKLNHRTYR